MPNNKNKNKNQNNNRNQDPNPDQMRTEFGSEIDVNQVKEQNKKDNKRKN